MNIEDIDYFIIEPMSHENDEFIGKSVLEVQRDYFARDLINEDKYDYKYYYVKRGISKEKKDFT